MGNTAEWDSFTLVGAVQSLECSVCRTVFLLLLLFHLLLLVLVLPHLLQDVGHLPARAGRSYQKRSVQVLSCEGQGSGRSLSGMEGERVSDG